MFDTGDSWVIRLNTEVRIKEVNSPKPQPKAKRLVSSDSESDCKQSGKRSRKHKRSKKRVESSSDESDDEPPKKRVATREEGVKKPDAEKREAELGREHSKTKPRGEEEGVGKNQDTADKSQEPSDDIDDTQG